MVPFTLWACGIVWRLAGTHISPLGHTSHWQLATTGHTLLCVTPSATDTTDWHSGTGCQCRHTHIASMEGAQAAVERRQAKGNLVQASTVKTMSDWTEKTLVICLSGFLQRLRTLLVHVVMVGICRLLTPGLIPGLHTANEKLCYKVTPSLIGWPQT